MGVGGVRTGQELKGLNFTEDQKTLAKTGPLNENNVTVFQLEDQQRGCFMNHSYEVNQDY